MNKSTSQATSVNGPLPALETIGAKRSLIPFSFAAIAIFFFFSFVEFRCNGTTAETLTGYNLVFGTRFKNPVSNGFDQTQNVFGQLDDPGNAGKTSSFMEGDKVKPSLWAILAFMASIGGVAVFWKGRRFEAVAGSALAIAGVIFLLILRSAIKREVSDQTGGGLVQIEANFQFGYWMSVLAFIVAGGISILRLRTGGKSSHDNTETNINRLNVFISSSTADKTE